MILGMTKDIVMKSEQLSSGDIKAENVKNEPVKNERRAMARYRDKLSVAVKIDESLLQAHAIEISLAGVRIECEGGVANYVFSRYIQVMPGENITAILDIDLINQQGLSEILNAKAKLISVNRVAQARYVVGFEFLELFETGPDNWKQYIASKSLV